MASVRLAPRYAALRMGRLRLASDLGSRLDDRREVEMKRYLLGAVIGAAITLMSAPRSDVAPAEPCSVAAAEVVSSHLSFSARLTAEASGCADAMEGVGEQRPSSPPNRTLASPARM